MGCWSHFLYPSLLGIWDEAVLVVALLLSLLGFHLLLPYLKVSLGSQQLNWVNIHLFQSVLIDTQLEGDFLLSLICQLLGLAEHLWLERILFVEDLLRLVLLPLLGFLTLELQVVQVEYVEMTLYPLDLRGPDAKLLLIIVKANDTLIKLRLVLIAILLVPTLLVAFFWSLGLVDSFSVNQSRDDLHHDPQILEVNYLCLLSLQDSPEVEEQCPFY